MNAWGKAIGIVIILLLLVAVAFLIVASCQGMTIIELFKSWFNSGETTEAVTETTKLIVNSLKL